jgi:hypothetical protein
MSSQTEINTNNRSSTDNSVKKVRKETSKKVQKELESGEREVESGEQDGNSVSTETLTFNYRSELPNMSQSNKPTFSSANSEKKIKKSKVSANDQDSTNTISSQMTKPVQPNWNEATDEEKDEYRKQVADYKTWQKKMKAESKKAETKKAVQVQVKDDDEQSADEEEQQSQSQPEEVPVDPSLEDEMEQDQKQDDEEQDQLIGTDQLTISTMEVPVPFPQQSVEPLSAMDWGKDDTLKPMSSPPSQDVPLSALDFEEETSKPSGDEPSRVVQFQDEGYVMEQPVEDEQEKCMFCRGDLKDRKVSKCSFCSGHLCLGACRDTIINEGKNNCPQCRKKYYRTEEEIELDDFEAAEAERQRQTELQRAELIRRTKIRQQMSQADQIRRETFAELEAEKREMRERQQREAEELQAKHQRENQSYLAKEQRLTCMTDAELVAHKVASIPVATLTAERRAEVRSTTPSRARGRSPARARASSPARARAPSPTPSNEGSRQGGRATAVQKDRSCAGCDIRVGDEIEFKLPKEERTWRIICLSANGTGSFRVLRSSNSPEFVGRQYSTGKSPINSAFQDYCFSLGIAKQAKTPWAGNMYKYRNGVALGKQK